MQALLCLPQINPVLVGALLPNAESAVEKNARETLHMLISSSNPQLLEELPYVSSSSHGKLNVLATASRSLYREIADLDYISSSSRTTVGLALFSEKTLVAGTGNVCTNTDV